MAARKPARPANPAPPSQSAGAAKAPPRRVPKAHPLGDAALLVELGRRLDTALNSRALALAAAVRKRRGVREVVAGHASVTVHYDPEVISFAGLEKAIGDLIRTKPEPAPAGRLHRIPVVYDGPDLAWVCQSLGLELAELVELHSRPIYRAFMSGFVPGWAYLGPVSPRLVLPRRSVPRTAVPAGSVAIAAFQTGVYPLPSPGGWHLIGRTPMRMFLPDSDPPTLIRPGDRVKFFAVPG